ncbi:hypothetical protein LOC68_05795 [Blastopirellula sp. JC732]|uniref:Uncharacterized protein n=1 Tax=Blastopirellula sediminis TaxID=2894196 RepID=A0A9X1MKI1_9BACT|nr:hypothetical protein [Blastopirellula sediminis]MCC9609323.1 hypothetical protein [Blastopirellula sediminis]MCC9627900.1 hypothetical protein [Blastopirellula sediminis]
MRLSAIIAVITMAIVLGSTQIGAAQHYGPAPCDTCGPSCGPTCGHGHCSPFKLCLPIIPPKVILSYIHKKATCGAGCGDEVYWGEWWSDPPKCDPCDCHGNYIGPNPSKICHPGLLGVRFGNRCCECGACGGPSCSCGPACGGDCGADCGCGHAHGGVVTEGVPTYAGPQEGEIIYEDSPTMMTSQGSGQRVYSQPTTRSTRTFSQPTYQSSSYPTSTTTTRSSVPSRNPRNLGRDSY